MHLKSNKMPTKSDIVEAIQLYGSLGLQVHITELDVACDQCDGSN
jgi:GH35 family endo-1,4-beta-xylanase